MVKNRVLSRFRRLESAAGLRHHSATAGRPPHVNGPRTVTPLLEIESVLRFVAQCQFISMLSPDMSVLEALQTKICSFSG